MIQAELSPRELVAGQETDLTIRLVNSGPGTCSNLVFKLVMPNEVPLVQGSDRIEISRLKSGEEATSVVRVRPESPGTWTACSTNFSYRDRHGFSCRVEDFQADFVVARPAATVPLPEPRLQVRLVTAELPLRAWGTLRGRIENIGEAPVRSVCVTASGPFEVDTRAGHQVVLGTVGVASHANFDFFVRVDDNGDVPVHVDASFADGSGRLRRRRQTFTVPVRRAPESVGAKSAAERMRILYLAANPIDTDRIRWEQDFNEIEDALRRSKHAAKFDLRSRFAVQDKDIGQALLEFRPNLVHLSAHGLTDGRPFFESEISRARPASIGGVARLFGLMAGFVNCVILSACHSRSLAEAVARHIDYVIGMSDRIEDRSAIRFSIGFYQALAAGEPVERAFELGCALIEMQPHHSADHEVPQLIRKSYSGT